MARCRSGAVLAFRTSVRATAAAGSTRACMLLRPGSGSARWLDRCRLCLLLSSAPCCATRAITTMRSTRPWLLARARGGRWLGRSRCGRRWAALIHLPVALRLYRSSSPRWLHQKGEHFEADHLISSSPDPRVATAWTPAMPYPRRTLWAIDAPQGAHAIWGTPNNRHQAEVLLAEGTSFSVLEVLRNCRGDALMHLSLAQGEQRRE